MKRAACCIIHTKMSHIIYAFVKFNGQYSTIVEKNGTVPPRMHSVQFLYPSKNTRACKKCWTLKCNIDATCKGFVYRRRHCPRCLTLLCTTKEVDNIVYNKTKWKNNKPSQILLKNPKQPLHKHVQSITL